MDLMKGKKPASAMTMIMVIALVANIAQRMRGILLAQFRLILWLSIEIKKSVMGVGTHCDRGLMAI